MLEYKPREELYAIIRRLQEELVAAHAEIEAPKVKPLPGTGADLRRYNPAITDAQVESVLGAMNAAQSQPAETVDTPELIRFTPYMRGREGQEHASMTADKDGQYVRHDDAIDHTARAVAAAVDEAVKDMVPLSVDAKSVYLDGFGILDIVYPAAQPAVSGEAVAGREADSLANAMSLMLNTLFDTNDSKVRAKCINNARTALAAYKSTRSDFRCPDCFYEDGQHRFDCSAGVADVPAAAPVQGWSYCPECGSTEIRYEEGDHKQCAICHQEWWTDVDYTEEVRKYLGDRRSQAASVQPNSGRDAALVKRHLARTLTDDAYVAWKLEGGALPVDLVLHCPACGIQHVDAPDERSTDWANPPHRSHLCHSCGHIWRPADVPTNGVAAVQTKGSADAPTVSPSHIRISALEEAAQIADSVNNHDNPMTSRDVADAIRALAAHPAPSSDAALVDLIERTIERLSRAQIFPLVTEWRKYLAAHLANGAQAGLSMPEDITKDDALWRAGCKAFRAALNEMTGQDGYVVKKTYEAIRAHLLAAPQKKEG